MAYIWFCSIPRALIPIMTEPKLACVPRTIVRQKWYVVSDIIVRGSLVSCGRPITVS